MDLVGQSLKKSRQEKKISLEEVSDSLKLSVSFIKNIEENNFLNYIDKVYLTAYIRTYADFLDLNADDLVSRFKSQIDFRNTDTNVELPKPVKKNNLFELSKIISFASIIFISLGFYFFFIQPNNIQPKYSISPDISEVMESEIEKINYDLDLKKISNNKKILEEEKNKLFHSNQVFFQDENKLSESDVVASLPSEEAIENLRNNKLITLKFLESTWIQIRDNEDIIIFSKLMDKNEEYSYFVNDNYSLTSGNAGNVLVLFDGKTKGKIGNKGEIVESLIINSEFGN